MMKLSDIECELVAACREGMDRGRPTPDHETWLRIATTLMGHAVRDNDAACLLICTPDGMRNLLLENDELLLGSDVDCSAHLPYRFVSTRHCLLQRTGHQWMLVDLDSANGTLVNGVRCPEKVLVAGDILQVGEVTILYLPPMDELGTTPSE